MSTIYNNILTQRGFRELDYQKDFLTSEYDSTKPFVLAAGTSSGKTFMAIMWLEIFYSLFANKTKKTLVIPYAMKVLRDNFSNELSSFNPSFSYCVATTKEELIDCLNSDCQVVVALPQSLTNSIDLLPKFHNFILDEAHQWYGKKTINDILKKIQPNYQLLLTGTPSRFIAKGDKFNFQFVPVMHLFGLKQVSNVRVEVVSSTYDFKQSDYLSSYGNLKGGKINKTNTDEALIAVCKEMLKRIKNPIKQPNASRVTKNVLSVFNEIGKTIVFCHSKKQANAIYNSLNGFKDLTGKVLLSHSENDSDSENFITFKNNDSYSILVAVDRGKLGFNIPELFNVVDFTLTQSLDMLMQMYGRLLRLSVTDKPKTYYKVATKNTASYYVDLMTAMLCLTDMEWYSKYNGKNMGGILIPKVLSNTKSKSKSNSTTSKSKSTKPLVSLADLDIPLDLNLFKSAYRNDADKFGTVAWTTLDDCRKEFFGLKKINPKGYWNYENCKKEALKYKLRMEFKNKNAKSYETSRINGWLDEICSHMDTKFTKWDKSSILKEAKKYKSLNEFYNKAGGAYNAAKRLNIFDDVTKNMKKGFIVKSDEELIEIAKKYKTQREWYKNDRNSFGVAKKRDCFDKCILHMPLPKKYIN